MSSKVHCILKHVGGAPPLQHKEIAIDKDEKLAKVVAFIKKQLRGSGESDSVFVYLKSSFSPNQNERVGVLLDYFGTEFELGVSGKDNETQGAQSSSNKKLPMMMGRPAPPPPPPASAKADVDADAEEDRMDILDMSYSEYIDSFDRMKKSVVVVEDDQGQPQE